MTSRRFNRSIVLAASLCVGTVSLIAGCGQKGPLYMPVEEGEPRQEQRTPETDKAASPTGDT